MAEDIKLSDHCLVDHFQPMDLPHESMPHTPKWLLRGTMMYVDRRIRFYGLWGATWRLLGVRRSDKNPNVCTI